jgi:3-hydroxyisobutyrate dehydrogenase-like beta-hydroxyacid dehydrogenase
VSGLSVGFVGFGEAASHIAKGLQAADLPATFAYDIQNTPQIRERAGESGTTLVATPGELANSSHILLSLVTASSAIQAAIEMAPFLTSEHVYVDMNSISPASKQSVEVKVRRRLARFVEAAIMAPVQAYGHRVPILLTGPAAPKLMHDLCAFGMRLKIIEGQTGAAAAVRMCRSIVVKGLESLLFECTRAASAFGSEEAVFDSLEESFPGTDWSALASYMIGRVVLHGERCADEMEEVTATLRAVNLEPTMSEAAARVQAWIGETNLKAQFVPDGPGHYREVMEALTQMEKLTPS